MKTNKFLITGLFIAIAGILFLTACNKDEEKKSEPISNKDIETAQNDALTDIMFEKSFENVDKELSELDQKSYKPPGLKSLSADSMNITVTNTDSVTREIIIDYGDGYVNWRGDTLKGKITITQKHGYMMQGSERTVVLDSLKINNIELRGTRTVTREGYNVNDYTIIWDIKLTGGKIIIDDTHTITREVTRKTRTRYFGPNVFDWNDDYVKITGEVTGVNILGESYTHTLNNLKRMMTCWFFTSGSITIQSGDRPEITLDYGNGECDQYATIIKGENEKQINLYRPRANK